MRTDDISYGQEYWDTLDGGLGYNDSTMWEDIAHTIKEVFGVRDGRDLTAGMSALDVGCAKGYLVKHLRRRGFDCWGTDFSEHALANADEAVTSWLRRHDLTSTIPMQWNEGYFHFVSCIETMEHIPEASVPLALAHIRRVLAPNAMVLFTICTAEHPDPFDDPTHVTIKDRSWWEAQLATAGFFREPKLEARLRTFHLFARHAGIFVARW
jgi:2-polyprenyl-3-methyl-5-hydroxy-6-metoxy-1,4-benzoquinol methylase